MKSKTAISQMLDGKRGTLESIPQSAKTDELLQKANIIELALISNLRSNEDLFESFENFTATLAEAHKSDMEDCYKEAFNFGIQIGIEIAEQNKFSENNQQLNSERK